MLITLMAKEATFSRTLQADKDSYKLWGIFKWKLESQIPSGHRKGSLLEEHRSLAKVMEVYHFPQLSEILGKRSVYKSSINELPKSNEKDSLETQQGKELGAELNKCR